jgi:hypothetical protein
VSTVSGGVGCQYVVGLPADCLRFFSSNFCKFSAGDECDYAGECECLGCVDIFNNCVCVGASDYFCPNLAGYANVGSVDCAPSYFVESVVADGSGSNNGVVRLFGQVFGGPF